MCFLCPHIQLLLGSKITGFFKKEKDAAIIFDEIKFAVSGLLAFPAL